MIGSRTRDTFDETSSGRPKFFVVLSLNVTVKAEMKWTNETLLIVAQLSRIALLKATQVIKFATLHVSALLSLFLLAISQLLADKTAVLS